MMDKNEIIEHLREIAKHAVHTIGEEPFIMSLDDGIAVHEAIEIIQQSQPERKRGKWIPCSERLPEEEYVLISKKPKKYFDGGWCVTIAIRMKDPRSRKVNWRDIGFGVIPDDNVLAWMPLPEPYQEGEQDE